MFVDYVYMFCCDFYKKREADIFKTSGLLLLTAVFLFNVLLVFFLIFESQASRVYFNVFYQNRYLTIIGLVVFIALVLYIRYFKATNYEQINNQFFSLPNGRRNRIRIAAISYIILSFVFAIGLAIYAGGKHNGQW